MGSEPLDPVVEPLEEAGRHGGARAWLNALDLTGLAGNPDLARNLETEAAENLKRVLRPPATEPDWAAEPGLDRMTDFLETKTVWHPMGI